MYARMPRSARTFLMPFTAAMLLGCSTADGTAKTSGAEPSPSAVTVTASVKALSEAELRALVLREDDLPQARPDGIPVQERTDPADRPSFKPASDADCQKAPDVGDEALQYREYSTLESGRRDELFIVVRTGNVIATYQALEVGRTSTFPTGSITKQTERLSDAQSG